MNLGGIQILLSIVFVAQDEAEQLPSIIRRIENIAASLVEDYEIVIVDNGSADQTSEVLRRLTSPDGEPNLQAYTLATRVDGATARWVGVENSLGDIVACIDPHHGDIENLQLLTREAANGNDIVFTRRTFPQGRKGAAKTMLYKAFGSATKVSTGLDLNSYSPSLIAISRRVVNYLSQFPEPQIRFRNLASTAGFRRTIIRIPQRSKSARDIRLRESLPRGIRLVASSSDNPLRLANSLSGLGAFASLAYSIYVLLIWAFNKDVAPGWVSLSIQQSGMFFLISLVLLVLSEYILEISRKTNSGPAYTITDELTSAKLTRKNRLNVEVETLAGPRSTHSLFKP